MASIGPDELDQALNRGGILLVDFSASWCGPCHATKPILADLAAEHPETLCVAEVDVVVFPELGERFGVQTVPTFIVFAGGQIRSRLVGTRTKRQLVRAVRGVMDDPT